MNKDYVFHFSWEDRNKKSYNVGLFAKFDNIFYVLMNNSKQIENAINMGYIDIPGIKPGQIYQSSELFDFLKKRVSREGIKNDPCEELIRTKGISMIDSFSLVPVMSEKAICAYKKKMIEAYMLQQKINKRVNKNEELKRGTEVLAY